MVRPIPRLSPRVQGPGYPYCLGVFMRGVSTQLGIALTTTLSISPTLTLEPVQATDPRTPKPPYHCSLFTVPCHLYSASSSEPPRTLSDTVTSGPIQFYQLCELLRSSNGLMLTSHFPCFFQISRNIWLTRQLPRFSFILVTLDLPAIAPIGTKPNATALLLITYYIPRDWYLTYYDFYSYTIISHTIYYSPK